MDFFRIKQLARTYFRSGKSLVLDQIRLVPYVHHLLGIPLKRIELADTYQYFTGEGDDESFLNTFQERIVEIGPHYSLNEKRFSFSKEQLYRSESFVMCLSFGKYCHIHRSVLTSEGYQLAKVSNHPSVSQKDHALFQKMYLPPIKRLNGCALLLSTLNDNNYYHCLFQIAPKIWELVRNGYEVKQLDYFLLELFDNNYQNEILSELQIPKEKIVDLKKFRYVRANELMILPFFYKPEPWICNNLRATFLTPDNILPKKRIYISRNRSKIRKLINEFELISLLGAFNFDIVFTEGMTIREQAKIFNSADVIISPHGAALANIVFCDPETKIIELRAESHDNGLGEVYQHLSSICNLRHFSYLCKEVKSKTHVLPRDFDIQVDIKEMEECLNFVLGTSSL